MRERFSFRRLPKRLAGFSFRSRRTRALAICCALFCLCGILSAQAYRHRAATTAAAVDNWGLSFQKEGQPPVGNASSEYLAGFDACYLGDTGQPVIYLTFDAGYENGHTAKILDTLKAHDAPAAFFLVGHYVSTQPELVRRMVAEGHTVGNHTNTHPDMSRIADRAAFEKELGELERLFQEATGQPMSKLYRPPQGKFSEANLRMAKEMGYKTYFWSLAYVDWYTDNQPTHEQAFAKLIPRIHNGAILLLHSTSSTNAEILDELLSRYEEMGYHFGSLQELANPGRAGP
ncbi:MAG: polysaccharide deacetylase family protein [Clostridiales bacterium]|nr:polysaccharide deacetylase family protein [Clostridiales bacterium]